jgi:hypothetical protein
MEAPRRKLYIWFRVGPGEFDVSFWTAMTQFWGPSTLRTRGGIVDQNGCDAINSSQISFCILGTDEICTRV